VVDDRADTVGRTAKVTNNSVTGLSAGTINYTAAPTATANGVKSVTIYNGKGNNTVNVLSTAAFAPVTIIGWGAGSNDKVVVGNAGSLTGIAGAVNVVNDSGHTALVVDDSADILSRIAMITSSLVTGLSAGAISYQAAPSAAAP